MSMQHTIVTHECCHACLDAQSMLDECGAKKVVVGGKVDEQDRFVEPTILKGAYWLCCITIRACVYVYVCL